MKQTGVEWLINELIRIGYFEDINPNITFEQAKEIEIEKQDEFAIGFAEWIEKQDWEIYHNNTAKELLEQFKNK